MAQGFISPPINEKDDYKRNHTLTPSSTVLCQSFLCSGDRVELAQLSVITNEKPGDNSTMLITFIRVVSKERLMIV